MAIKMVRQVEYFWSKVILNTTNLAKSLTLSATNTKKSAGWVDVWMWGLKAMLRIACRNQKSNFICMPQTKNFVPTIPQNALFYINGAVIACFSNRFVYSRKILMVHYLILEQDIKPLILKYNSRKKFNYKIWMAGLIGYLLVTCIVICNTVKWLIPCM